MEEQLYMKLKDDVKRPILNPDTIDRTNKSFRRMVEQYSQWNKSIGDTDSEVSDYEDDIIDCLKQFDKDGYALAKHLQDTLYIEPDAALVNVLDGMYAVHETLTKVLYTQWVKENFLAIPSDVIGKSVTYKQKLKPGKGFITTIAPERYQVTVDENPDRKGGYVIDYENITFV